VPARNNSNSLNHNGHLVPAVDLLSSSYEISFGFLNVTGTDILLSSSPDEQFTHLFIFKIKIIKAATYANAVVA
jgi:hypothetical protein